MGCRKCQFEVMCTDVAAGTCGCNMTITAGRCSWTTQHSTSCRVSGASRLGRMDGQIDHRPCDGQTAPGGSGSGYLLLRRGAVPTSPCWRANADISQQYPGTLPWHGIDVITRPSQFTVQCSVARTGLASRSSTDARHEGFLHPRRTARDVNRLRTLSRCLAGGCTEVSATYGGPFSVRWGL